MSPSPRIVLAALAAGCLTLSAPCQEPPGMLATGKYLFVVRGDWLYQFDVDTLHLHNRVRLDAPGAEERAGGGAARSRLREPRLEDSPEELEEVEIVETEIAEDVEVVEPPRQTDIGKARNAVEAGLAWLASHQDPDGKWDSDGFMKHDKGPQPAAAAGPGNAVHDVGATGLSMLAMLGSGSTLRAGPYSEHLKKAAKWLKEQQQENGLYGTNASHDFIYDHAIATYAMCEAYGLSDYKLLKSSAQQALNYLESHRNPYAVWRYQPRDNDNDTSVTSWCLIAMKSGQFFGLEVNDKVFDLGLAFLDGVTTADGRCGYTKRGEESSRKPGNHAVLFPVEQTETLTAAGLFCRFFLGQDPKEKPVMRAAADRISQKPVRWDEKAGTVDHYYWYYGTYAMYQMGGAHWKWWQSRLGPAVVDHQVQEGDQAGSWNPVGAWGHDGGRVYSTALMVLTLEAYYRYARLIR